LFVPERHICLHCVHIYACTCVHVCSYLHVLDEYSCPCIHIYIMHNTGVDHQCCLMFTWNSHSIVFTLESRYNTLCILCLMFTWNSYCILYFLPPLTKGGAGIRGIITPVYRTCVYSNNYSLELVCTVTTIFCSLCKTEIPLFCTVYSKERTPSVHLYHNLHFSTHKTLFFTFN